MPLKVLLVTVRIAELYSAPPVLLLKVLALILAVLTLYSPAAIPELLLSKVLLVTVSVP